ncbi:hypothetical protein ACVBEG_26770 [Pseudomonas sp. GG8]
MQRRPGLSSIQIDEFEVGRRQSATLMLIIRKRVASSGESSIFLRYGQAVQLVVIAAMAAEFHHLDRLAVRRLATAMRLDIERASSHLRHWSAMGRGVDAADVGL